MNHKREYDWTDPEEWVRARTIAFLIVSKSYPANRIRTEVLVPRRTPNDWADIVVYRDDRCAEPYLVIENKAAGQTRKSQDQGIEQLFGNANSMRAPYGLYDEWSRTSMNPRAIASITSGWAIASSGESGINFPLGFDEYYDLIIVISSKRLPEKK